MLDPLLPLAAASADEVGVVGALVIVLGAAVIVAMLARRLGLAVIPAFLLAGIALGPRGFGLVPDPGKLGAISHLAIVVLLFGIGLELHLSTLRGRVTQLVGSALCAVGVSIAAGWALGLAFGLAAPLALLVAMALSLSSTAVVLKELARRRELVHPVGRFSIAILVVQDLAVVVMLAVLPLLAAWSGIDAADDRTFGSAGDVLLRLLAVGGLVAASRWAIVPLLRESLRGGGPELLLLLGLAYALGIAWATEALGFSLEMGAFLAGFVLSGTTFRHELATQVVPIRDLFLAVFFTTLGMQVDPHAVATDWTLILATTAALLVTKSLLVAASCWVFGSSASIAGLVGMSLGQAGEFSLVLLGAAAGIGLLPDRASDILIGVVVLSLLATPGAMALGRRLARGLVDAPFAPWAGALREPAPVDAVEPPCPPVIIAGFGPVGQRVSASLAGAGVACRVIELNAATVRRLQSEGRSAVLGDVASEAVLLRAGLLEARALVLTMPVVEAAARACQVARRLRPDIHITVRAPLEATFPTLRAAGADAIVGDEAAAGDVLADLVNTHLVQADDEATAARANEAEG